MEFEEALCKTVHGDFEDLRNIQELCTRRYTAPGHSANLMEFFVKQSWFNWSVIIWRSICISCFSKLVCSTDIVWSWYIIWSVVWFRALCCVIGLWMFMILVKPMQNYLLNSFSMDMANRLVIMASCCYFLNRLKLFSDQIFIHIQLLLGEDQVVMKIMTRMASWLCGIYFCYVLYEMMLISLHIHPCLKSRVH